MSNLRLLLSLPFLVLSILITGVVMVLGVPAVIIGGDKASKIFDSVMKVIYE